MTADEYLALVIEQRDDLLKAGDALAATVERVVHPAILREALADYRQTRRKVTGQAAP